MCGGLVDVWSPLARWLVTQQMSNPVIGCEIIRGSFNISIQD